MKKRTLTITLALILILGMFAAIPVSADTAWTGQAATAFAGGSGTKADPYVIETAEQLAFLAKSVNEGTSYKGQYLVLKNDIALNDIAGYANWGTQAPANVWAVIGLLEAAPFEGNFDGNGKKISGLYVKATMNTETPVNEFYGLFGVVKGGSVTNVTLEKAYLHVEGTVSKQLGIGALAGLMLSESTVDNCHANGVTILCKKATSNTFLGGLIAKIDSGTYVTTVSATGSMEMLAEENTTYPTASYANNFCGGICGVVSGASEIDGMICDVDVIACGEAGGLVGILGGGGLAGIIKNGYSLGDVSGVTFAGGLVGRAGQGANSEIQNCFAVGAVSGVKADDEWTTKAGYLCGAIRHKTTLKNCYYIESVEGMTAYKDYAEGTDNSVLENVEAKTADAFKGAAGMTLMGYSTDVWEASNDYPVFKAPVVEEN
ncbi:MAG: hypothetical protein J6B71_01810, partial [Clostridia bacterium]|nr:hypothetical protein [Clostridia bacterium]